MPTPETINSADLAVIEVPQSTTQPSQRNQSPKGNYLRPIILLIAVYALIINRSYENKRRDQQDQFPRIEQHPDYSNAYVYTSKKDKQQSMPLIFYVGLSIPFHPTFLIVK